MKQIAFLLAFSLFLASCEEKYPKPKALLRLDYPPSEYDTLREAGCPFMFLKNKRVSINKENCNLQLSYKAMKATVYLNYRDVHGNLKQLLQDAQKLTYEHVAKASNISERVYENAESKVYGVVYKVKGNAASQIQFYVTDSIKHFMLGSLYFYATPNYDSIYPAVATIERDINKLVESLRWNN